MNTNHYDTEEYPFKGVFYKIQIDTSKPLDERTEEEIIIMETLCDMYDGGTLSLDTFSIFFPFDIEHEILPIKDGDLFRGNICGMEQKGRVRGIYPSQLGGCKVELSRV